MSFGRPLEDTSDPLASPEAVEVDLGEGITFRFAGRIDRIDQLNTGVMNAVQRGGEAYLSSAIVKGKFALRACIINFRTTRADIDKTLDVIRSAARELGPEKF